MDKITTIRVEGVEIQDGDKKICLDIEGDFTKIDLDGEKTLSCEHFRAFDCEAKHDYVCSREAYEALIQLLMKYANEQY